MFFIIGEHAQSAVAKIRNLIANRLKFFYEPCSTQRCGGFLAAGTERRGAGGCTNQGNLVWLTDDFDRQSTLLI
jgi:hypothetical protein